MQGPDDRFLDVAYLYVISAVALYGSARAACRDRHETEQLRRMDGLPPVRLGGRVASVCHVRCQR